MKEMKKSGMAPPVWIEEVEFIIPPVVFHDAMEIIDAEQQIEFHHSGGHTDDSSWVYFPEEKVLFAGDLIFSEMLSYAGDGTCDPEKWMVILRNWVELPINKVVPGHGPVMGLEIVERILNGFEKLKQNTLKALSENITIEKIALPGEFDVPKDATRLVQKTLNHWLQYYAKNNK